jgi:hypothetical protein
MALRSAEPSPLAILERQPLHPWLVVGVCCISAFIGQLNASIVQLALPALAGRPARGPGQRIRSRRQDRPATVAQR